MRYHTPPWLLLSAAALATRFYVLRDMVRGISVDEARTLDAAYALGGAQAFEAWLGARGVWDVDADALRRCAEALASGVYC